MMTKSDLADETVCDWTVSGMDCGSCAGKIRNAVTRLPGVSGVEVGIMSERLRLTLDENKTGREQVEKTVRALGYGIKPRGAEKKEFVLPGAAVSYTHLRAHEPKAKLVCRLLLEKKKFQMMTLEAT